MLDGDHTSDNAIDVVLRVKRIKNDAKLVQEILTLPVMEKSVRVNRSARTNLDTKTGPARPIFVNQV